MKRIIDALSKANKMLIGYDCNNTVFLVEAEKEARRILIYIAELERAIRTLLQAKKLKDEEGKTETYDKLKKLGWKLAQEVLTKLEKE